jgi:hypothetical protein
MMEQSKKVSTAIESVNFQEKFEELVADINRGMGTVSDVELKIGEFDSILGFEGLGRGRIKLSIKAEIQMPNEMGSY